MGPVSMSDSCKVNEKVLLPQRLKTGLFFKILCKRKVFNLIHVNGEHQRETYCKGDQGKDFVEIIPVSFKFIALLAWIPDLLHRFLNAEDDYLREDESES